MRNKITHYSLKNSLLIEKTNERWINNRLHKSGKNKGKQEAIRCF